MNLRPRFGLGRTVRAGLMAGCAFFAFQAPAAQAFELFGYHLWGGKEPDETVLEPQTYTLNLTVTPDDDGIADRIQNASQLYGKREEPAAGTAGLVSRARGDYARILTALYARGRYGGVITITIAGRPVDQITPDVTLPADVPVKVNVDPGPIYHFAAIDIVNPPDFNTRETHRIDTPQELGLTQGAPAESGAILKSETSLTNAWKQFGYPKVKVEREIVADHATRTVDVRLAVDTGPYARLGRVSVSGTERMNPGFVGYMTGIKGGEEYDPDRIDRARERLRRLEVFRSITIQEAEAVGSDGFMPLSVRVAERKRRLIGGEAKYSTIDGATLGAYWVHRNLFGHAERLRIEGSVSGIDGADYENFDYMLATTFTRPGIFTPDTDLVTNVTAKREDNDTYKEQSISGQVGITHRFTEDLSLDTAVKLERSRIEDALGINHYLIASLPTKLEYDTRDNKLDPAEGIHATLSGEPFYEFYEEYPALRSQAELATYYSFDRRGYYVLAARAKAGNVVGPSIEDLPASRRFLAGGGGSVRGYSYETIGVGLPNGETTGGKSLLEGSLEFRARVTDSIGVVPFVDIGTVSEDAIPDFSEDLKIGVGVGLRYYTGLGPIRVDVAMPLDPGKDDSDYAIYVGIGQAF
ncbi:translocation and assembly module TamA [Rhodopseudomonas julia]|uniref:Translocation and assembly module TamA n=1 Tax=Rhodopseudomonas julia TaxID=200617 RepID=A0ABU0C4R5_9BRAD|nr:autotransporter assembly complex family protein [Rhodopseudomonas julia]MDQ0325503.1 translocation and assembly module TamA [Rhodopseudomonas julia]